MRWLKKIFNIFRLKSAAIGSHLHWRISPLDTNIIEIDNYEEDDGSRENLR